MKYNIISFLFLPFDSYVSSPCKIWWKFIFMIFNSIEKKSIWFIIECEIPLFFFKKNLIKEKKNWNDFRIGFEKSFHFVWLRISFGMGLGWDFLESICFVSIKRRKKVSIIFHRRLSWELFLIIHVLIQPLENYFVPVMNERPQKEMSIIQNESVGTLLKYQDLLFILPEWFWCINLNLFTRIQLNH